MKSTTAPLAAVAAPRTNLRLRIELLLWRYGVIWVANALMVFIALIGSTWILPALRQQTRDELERNSTLTVSSARLRPDSGRAAAPAQASILDALPDAGGIDAQVRAIYALAAEHGLSISKTTFRTVESRRTGMVRLQMSVPIRNQYPPIADFVEELLRQAPSVSIDQLRFRRNSVTQSEGEADLQLSCWAVRPRTAAGAKQTPAAALTSAAL